MEYYKKHLTLPTPAIQEIDKTTEMVSNQLANPNMPGNWYRAGLVVGHIQFGKTGNFVGLERNYLYGQRSPYAHKSQ